MLSILTAFPPADAKGNRFRSAPTVYREPSEPRTLQSDVNLAEEAPCRQVKSRAYRQVWRNDFWFRARPAKLKFPPRPRAPPKDPFPTARRLYFHVPRALPLPDPTLSPTQYTPKAPSPP